MNNGNALAAVDQTVPWQFSQAGGFTQWVWETRDFVALVVSEGGRWTWEVKTTTQVQVGAGPGVDFDTCADLALEAVGKAFPSSAGYGRWTAAAAQKYTLANGVRVDLSAGAGKAVRLTLTSGQTIDGVLHLGDWLLHLVEGAVQRDVHPATVLRVEKLA